MATLAEVLQSLPRVDGGEAAHVTKTAARNSYGDHVRALAEAIRQVPEPQISLASLNAVKTAGFRNAPPEIAGVDAEVDNTLPGAPLRKLASAARVVEDERAVLLYKKSALALRAMRGLTLLRERIARP